MKTQVRKLLFGFVLLLSLVIPAAVGAAAGEPSRVVVVPFKINADRDLSFLKDGIVDMLTSRLSREGNAAVVGREDTDRALAGVSAPVNEEVARAIGAGLKADYVLFGSLTIFGNSISMDAKMVDVHKKRPALAFFKQAGQIDEVIPRINLLAAEINETVFGRTEARQAKVLSAKPAPAESNGTEPAGFWKSKNFEIAIKGIALADVDGDGKTEIVLISDRRIYVYRFDGQRLVKIWESAGKSHDGFIGIDAADINGNGRAEIFVSSAKAAGHRLGSFVLEWDGHDFGRLVNEAPWYYRVIGAPDRSPVLLGQKRRMDEPFVPGIHQLVWHNGRYKPTEPLRLPKGINIFGFALADVMNTGQQRIVSFDQGDHILLLTPSGEEQCKSDERYGGSLNYVEFSAENENVPERLFLPQRICVRDIDGNGKQDVVVASNQGPLGRLFAHLRSFESGRMACLSWKGLGLGLMWQTPKISGHISDCAVGDLDNDGTEEVVAVQVAKQGTALSAAASSIISYELGRPAASEHR
ncbi:MAG: VCBS repeat-containing protein [Desulfobacterales bacterium]|nr:VCBS repeat-containing protein [Desulfobacterales bacterium]